MDDETARAGASATITDGFSASSIVDDVTVIISVDVDADDVSASFTLDDVTLQAEASVTPTSITLNISLDSVLIWGLVDDAQTDAWWMLTTLKVLVGSLLKMVIQSHGLR